MLGAKSNAVGLFGQLLLSLLVPLPRRIILVIVLVVVRTLGAMNTTKLKKLCRGTTIIEDDMKMTTATGLEFITLLPVWLVNNGNKVLESPSQ
jgi:hypothetical protein